MFKRLFDRETVAAISTFLGFSLVVPAFFLFRSKDEYVRFWSAQALTFFILILLLDWLILLARIFNFLPSLIFIFTAIVWLMMVYKSWLGVTWEIPLIGKLAKRVQKQAERQS